MIEAVTYGMIPRREDREAQSQGGEQVEQAEDRAVAAVEAFWISWESIPGAGSHEPKR